MALWKAALDKHKALFAITAAFPVVIGVAPASLMPSPMGDSAFLVVVFVIM